MNEHEEFFDYIRSLNPEMWERMEKLHKLLDLVERINSETLAASPPLEQLTQSDHT